jgi:hypothetical protein
MTQELDNLVKELCAFDADLAKDPALVRRMVEELQRSKPAVVIDDVFRVQLRDQLMSIQVKPEPNKVLPWWFVHRTAWSGGTFTYTYPSSSYTVAVPDP